MNLYNGFGWYFVSFCSVLIHCSTWFTWSWNRTLFYTILLIFQPIYAWYDLLFASFVWNISRYGSKRNKFGLSLEITADLTASCTSVSFVVCLWTLSVSMILLWWYWVNECKHWSLMEWFQYCLCISIVWTWRPLVKKITFVKNMFRKYVLEDAMCIYTHISTPTTALMWCDYIPCVVILIHIWSVLAIFREVFNKGKWLMASCYWYVQIIQLKCRILKLNPELIYLYMKELPF
jgi:hypothetical protein